MGAVVDTNVLLVANRAAPQASPECVLECVDRLEGLKQRGVIVLDSDWIILNEYQHKVNSRGQGVGDVFLYWALQNKANSSRCELYSITPLDDYGNFQEFPNDSSLRDFDLSDRKFAALAVVSGTPVWNAVDPDWWEHREALQRNGIQIEFLCPYFFAAEE